MFLVLLIFRRCLKRDYLENIHQEKIDENNWEVNNIDHLVRRIKQNKKTKELNEQTLQDMMEGD